MTRVLSSLFLLFLVGVATPVWAQTAPVLGYRVVQSYPHDPTAFTQGLLWRDGYLYESTGQHGASGVRQVRLEDGEVIRREAIPRQYFGEGLVDRGDRLIGLTWRHGIGFVWDIESFTLVTAFTYPGEGWGLTRDDRRLIMSDGTAELRFLDPDTFAEIGRVRVTDGGEAVANLNELEWIEGEVWANIWGSDRIARIDPETGRVAAWVDLNGLLPEGDRPGADVLNGIAWDAQNRRLFVTGKYWPTLFHIEVIEP
ncbi:MAG: glutaminyl-peptide cyclotransferase [Brevundimonas sp.]|uniref:glutaminyl-peptide cyclotransferase n=1 Tax=Brevundimonas sp. TaxID=1871086 RepID=UPI00391B305E